MLGHCRPSPCALRTPSIAHRPCSRPVIGRSLGSGSETEECSILSVKLDVDNDPKYTKLDVQVRAETRVLI